MHRASVAKCIVANLIEKVIPFGIVVSRLHLHILKINKNDKPLSLARNANSFTTSSTSHTCKQIARSCHCSLTSCKSLKTSLITLCRTFGSKAGNALYFLLMSYDKSIFSLSTSFCVMSHLCRSTQHTVVSHIRITISLVSVHDYRHSIFGTHKVEVLVATHHDCNHGAIRLTYLCLTALCWNSRNSQCTKQGN